MATPESIDTTAVLRDIRSLEPFQCGVEARKHFGIAKNWRNLNHGMAIEINLRHSRSDVS
jgi:hypothetical protein